MKQSATMIRAAVLGSMAALAAVAPLGPAHAGSAGVVDPPDAGASAEVIAQGIVAFDDGEFHWTLAALAINRELAPVGSTTSGFVLANGPAAILVESPDGAAWRLGPGEATFRPAGSSTSAAAMADGPAALTTINIEVGPGSGVFTPGPGARDVDLIRTQLAPQATVTVHAEVSALVYVTAGEVSTDDTTISAGATAIREGDVTLVNRSTERATAVVAAIGPAVDVLAVGEPSDTQAPAGTPAPAPAPSATTPSASTPPTTAAATTTVDPVTTDADQDGLTGADESLRGTNPDDADSDDDGLDDGVEVFESGTNPTVADGDGDGLNDGDEIAAGTNPNLDEDSDGDGVPDSDEVLSGGDPFDPNDQP